METSRHSHVMPLSQLRAHTHSEPTSCSAGRPSRRSSCTYLSPSLSVHECFQLRLQHHHSALRFEFHVQVLDPMLDYRQTFNCAPAWSSGPSSPFRPRRCRVASPAPYGRHPSPMSPSPMAESKTNMATVLNASWEWLGGRRRGRGRGRISRVGVRADSRPLLFFSSGAACCRHLAPSCHRIIHDIGIILHFLRCGDACSRQRALWLTDSKMRSWLARCSATSHKRWSHHNFSGVSTNAAHAPPHHSQPATAECEGLSARAPCPSWPERPRGDPDRPPLFGLAKWHYVGRL